jgi:uncharacterized membrane protein
MSVNPFDIRTVVQAKHAQHVVLIHFPIALFIAGAAFDWMGQWTKRAAYATAAYFNFTLAALSTIPVVITGFVAWQWALEGQRLKGILLEHLILGAASSVLLWIVFWMHRRARHNPDVAVSGARIAFELFGVLLVSLTGHLGGFLSGVNLPS